MRQIRSATASNFVPMPPGRFHPHRHLFTLQTKGRGYQLERPEIITPAQALPAYPALYRRKMRSRNIQDFVWAHRAAAR